MEVDIHFPRLTVSETVDFAVHTKTGTAGLGRKQREKHTSMMSDVLLKIFGLGPASNILVGSEFVSGVSGGERKRVSLAEVVSKLFWAKNPILTSSWD